MCTSVCYSGCAGWAGVWIQSGFWPDEVADMVVVPDRVSRHPGPPGLTVKLAAVTEKVGFRHAHS